MLLAQLLVREHTRIAAVLEQSVHLDDHLVLTEQHVDAIRADRGIDPGLQVGAGQPPVEQAEARDRLQRRLGPAVGQLDHATRCPDAGPATLTGQRLVQLIAGREPLAQRGVGGDETVADASLPRQVDDRPLYAGDQHPEPVIDFALPDGRDAQPDVIAGAGATPMVCGQRRGSGRSEQGQTVQRRGARESDHGAGSAQRGGRCLNLGSESRWALLGSGQRTQDAVPRDRPPSPANEPTHEGIRHAGTPSLIAREHQTLRDGEGKRRGKQVVFREQVAHRRHPGGLVQADRTGGSLIRPGRGDGVVETPIRVRFHSSDARRHRRRGRSVHRSVSNSAGHPQPRPWSASGPR